MRLLFVVELREGVDMRVVRYVAIVAVFVGFWINAVSAMPLVDSSDLNQIAIDQESSFTPTNDISAETGTKIIQSSETPITDGATLIVPKKDAVLQSAEIIPPVFIDDSAQKGYSLHTAKEDLSALNLPLQRTTFVGVGINLSELLFGSRDKDESTTKQVGRFFFDHIQMPYTYVRTNKQF